MTKEQEKARQTIIKFGNGLLIMGLVLAAFGVYFLYLGNETLRWSKVTGQLVNVVIQSHVDIEPTGNNTVKRLETEYFIRLDYRYEVDGSPYFSSRFSFGDGSTANGEYYQTQEEARAAARKKYQSGKELPVYHDPQEPGEAVLSPGWNWGTFVPLLFGIFLIASGWFMRRAVSNPKASN